MLVSIAERFLAMLQKMAWFSTRHWSKIHLTKALLQRQPAVCELQANKCHCKVK